MATPNTTPTEVPEQGATVRYVGSVASAHGTYQVWQQCECEGCWADDDSRLGWRNLAQAGLADVRLVLVGPEGTRLDHVRVSSVLV